MKRLTLLLIALLPLALSAQDSDLGNWIIYFGNKQINSSWNWHHEIQYRNYNAIGDLEQLLIRTGIGYNLSENNNNVLLGYGYILSENYLEDGEEKVSINEHRIYQQFITKQTILNAKLQHRYRFEQRWVEGDFKMRFRYFLGINLPLSRKEITDKTLYASAYNEIFLNTESGKVFDRNRLYGGLGYRFSKTVRVEAGYMNQFFNTGGRDQINLVTFVNF
ncbi:DUF2490 domain-containing protein [Pontibacter sp. G13]|uniref:DUF2490 domain-containing protein n=1 Tax=Pontibacter sp. G13 TaxID=3074898 RepID=UPI00288A5C72|nr:DUF2490 domain-containing protein [Pontibacter sp. G13]WNJ18703.1 DUF2490 domain-containing protein [Pontibacter sp. G13]